MKLKYGRYKGKDIASLSDWTLRAILQDDELDWKVRQEIERVLKEPPGTHSPEIEAEPEPPTKRMSAKQESFIRLKREFLSECHPDKPTGSHEKFLLATRIFESIEEVVT